MTKVYDEDRVLTGYIWEHNVVCSQSLNERVSTRIIFEMKTRHTPPELRDERFEETFWPLDPAVTSVLEGGHWAYLRRVRERILA